MAAAFASIPFAKFEDRWPHWPLIIFTGPLAAAK
jgi:hypothetical protein